MRQEGANLVAKAALGGVFPSSEQLKTEEDLHAKLSTHGKHQDDATTIFQGTILTLVDSKFSLVEAIAIQGDSIVSIGSLTDA
jgi:hypothetical protein